ncbi:Glycerol-3-phosphate_dehydrogenase [Hexamita inflata]|uniref:Glycerol-3-phosphate dehydrogenase n=1 Tax=Hexamita inflata TaxID=28002 RepID=A0AA86UWU7_9EUKA|nr:Glycerol-3-phosphate dehydrogenase [Hexamita inflata]
MSNYDVVIVGAGCVGSFTAFYASKYNLSVCLLESKAEPAMGTTNANSGIVHAGHNTAKNTLKAKLVDRGNALITDLADKLNFGFKQCGELVVARSEAEYDKLEEMRLYSASIGVPIEQWDEQKIRAEEPNLHQNIKKALFAPTAGVVNPYELTVAAVNSAVKNGAKLVCNCKVSNIVKQNAGYLLQTNKGEFKAKVVVNCAGLYADEIAKMVDPSSPITIIPRKGEEFILDKDYQGLVKRVIFPLPTGTSKGTLVIPTVDGTIMVGPTAEVVQNKEDRATSSEGMNKVFGMVQQLVPMINPGMVISSFAGCRAVDVSEDFVINQKDGFINAAGMQSPGLTASPAIGQVLVEEMLKNFANATEKTNWTYAPLHKKFNNMDLKGKEEFATSDCNHTKIICSCEMVTEADVQNAITDGAVTLDGVKTRTRAGMGRCQGGFCSSRIVEILADRTGLTEQQITKRGDQTALSVGKIGNNSSTSVFQGVKEYIPIPTAQSKPVTLSKNENMNQILSSCEADIIIVGAGPAGLAAGLSAVTQDKSKKVLILERAERSGGILLQCIHGGFGLKRFGKELTGPEYSEMLTDQCVDAGANIVLNAYVTQIHKLEHGYTVTCVVQGLGLRQFTSKALVSAVGCRERTRHGVRIQGTRPSGLYTAGLGQAMINLNGQLPGKKIVILGSGDIGLIMARRCTLEGANVIGVYELLPRCSGLERNVAQCLTDFNIPLHLSKTVVEVKGKDRVEAVIMAEVDPVTLRPDMTKTETIECDCLLLSVGLIPQTKLTVQAGGLLHDKTRNPIVDSYKRITETSFACGNCLQVHDLADDAAEEGEIAGFVAVEALKHDTPSEKVPVTQSKDILFTVPQSLYVAEKTLIQQKISMRVAKPFGKIVMKAFYGDVEVGKEEVEEAVPAEMIHVKIDQDTLSKSYKQDQSKQIELRVEVIPEEHHESANQNEKVLTCIVCPRGCKIHVKVNESNEIEEIKGNSCPRGEKYARQEHIEPFRVFSSTVDVQGSAIMKRLPVKLSKPVPRSKLIQVADAIKQIQVTAPIRMGQVVSKNILGLCDIVACCSVE